MCRCVYQCLFLKKKYHKKVQSELWYLIPTEFIKLVYLVWMILV